MQSIRKALDELGYEPIEGALYYQFARKIDYLGQARSLKIDLLAQVPVEGRGRVKMDKRRIRPRSFAGLHAHTTPEAITVDRHLLPVHLGQEPETVTVYVPHPFSYLVLKLAALRDRIGDSRGAYHAFDLYATLAMMTEREWDEGNSLRDEYRETDALRDAQSIVRDLFAGADSRGVLRLREQAAIERHPLTSDDVAAFVDNIRALLLGTA